MSNKRNITLKRSALTVALGMCLASSVVLAQSSAGSLFGRSAAGSTVTIENTQTGTKREITADSSGRFAATQLSPGSYKVTSGGITRTVNVNVGTGSNVNLVDDKSLDTVVVKGFAGTTNPIDVSSVESTAVFSAEQIQKLPVSRDVTSVALLTPGTVRGDGTEGSGRLGGLASFSGASVGENGYYVNGFDVTDMRSLVSFANIPFEAIGQQQVKKGGYGAEYGRSLGGVISIVTKGGTNEWRGGVSAYWAPESLQGKGLDVATQNPESVERGDDLYRYASDNNRSSIRYNVYAGGPLIEDRLFFFGIVEGKDIESNTYGSTTSSYFRDRSPNTLAKIDWNITDNHKVEFTAINNSNKSNAADYSYDVDANGDDRYNVGQHEILSSSYTVESGGEIYIGKYTGYFGDNLTVSAMYGKSKVLDLGGYTPPQPGADCVAAYDSRVGGNSQLDYFGCWNESFFTLTNPFAPKNEDTRESGRIDFEWSLGDHLIRFGADNETYTSSNAGLSYSGGNYYRYFQAGATETTASSACGASSTNRLPGRCVGGEIVAQGQNYVRARDYQTQTASFEVKNSAFYLEDNWQVTDNLNLYAGLRAEQFENFNADGISIVDSGYKMAPRLGFSWDAMGDSTVKVYGNAGRYYIPIASNTNIRMSGFEYLEQKFCLIDGPNTATGKPVVGGQDLDYNQICTTPATELGTTTLSGNKNSPNPGSVVAKNLSPMYQDEFILGMQKAFANNWVVGVRGVYREVKSGMDDFCGHDVLIDLGVDPDTIGCVLLNPGNDTVFDVLLDGDTELTEITVSAEDLGLPVYSRKYAGVEFQVERATADWSLSASYTWSHAWGNTDGYINSSIGQEDAGLSQDWDYASFTQGADGDLTFDRRHVIKAFGSYNLTEEWRVGGNLLVTSGAPISCLGYSNYDGVDDSYEDAYTTPSSYFCLDAEGATNTLTPRGSVGRLPWTWNFDASLAYTPNWANQQLTLGLDVFNIFGLDAITKREETSALGGRPNQEYNPEYNNIQGNQAPRAVRLSARWEF